MTQNLVTEIIERLDVLQEIAEEAAEVWGDGVWYYRIGAEGWEIHPDAATGHVIAVSTEETVKHIVNTDPASVLRGLAEDRDILARHANKGYPGFGPDLCGWCSEDLGAEQVEVHWPCPEVKSLARRHGIEVPE